MIVSEAPMQRRRIATSVAATTPPVIAAQAGAARSCATRDALAAALTALVTILLVRTWIVDVVIVSSGSMAPALCGPHSQVRCAACGHGFACGIDDDDSRVRPAVCPDCGAAGEPLSQWPQSSGDRVLVVKRGAWAPLRRFDAVAIRRPDEPGRMAVKRLVGMPGETISLANGDVWIDGRIARKSLDEQLAMAVLVEDDRASTSAASRWSPRTKTSGWRRHEAIWTWTPPSVGSRERRTTAARDWLVFRRADAAPIDDRLAYNQTRPVLARHAVRDVLLDCDVQLPADGAAYIRANDGAARFDVELTSATGRVVLRSESGVALAAVGADLGVGAWRRLHVSLVDERLLVAVGGQTVLAHNYQRVWDSDPPVEPFALAVAGQGAVRDLQILRDVYNEPAVPTDPSLVEGLRLGPDELFVLGDNPPQSADSRQWRDGLTVSQNLLLGRVLRLPW